MIPIQNCKKASLFDPATATNAGTATGYVDTLGYDYCVIDLDVAVSDATNPGTVLKVCESADATNTTDIVSLTGGTSVVSGSTGFVIPNNVTAADGSILATFNVDCRNRARYLHLLYSPETTQTCAAIANLYRAKQTPVGVTAQAARVVVVG